MSCAPPQPAPVHPGAGEMRWGCSSERAGLSAPARARGSVLQPLGARWCPGRLGALLGLSALSPPEPGEECAQRRRGN